MMWKFIVFIILIMFWHQAMAEKPLPYGKTKGYTDKELYAATNYCYKLQGNNEMNMHECMADWRGRRYEIDMWIGD